MSRILLVLGLILFLIHINDLPLTVSSQVRLFADDCLLYRQIHSLQDQLQLQQDLKSLEKWADDWGMSFNAKKCYIMTIRKKTTFFYKLNDHILETVSSIPYLGVKISEDLKWSEHIGTITKKASSTLGFMRRNLRSCPTDCRRAAYFCLVRSKLEYSASVWDPYYQTDIDRIEQIQRRAARFICNDYKSRHEGAVTNMLDTLQLQPLQERRKHLRLALLFKISQGLMPSLPENKFLTKADPNKRQVKPKSFKDFQAKNIIAKQTRLNNNCFQVKEYATAQREHSFFIRTAIEWNSLDQTTIDSKTPEAFKNRLGKG